MYGLHTTSLAEHEGLHLAEAELGLLALMVQPVAGVRHGRRLAFHPREAQELEKCLSVSLGVKRQPTLFIYGKEKNVAFHTQKQLDQIREGGGRVLAVGDAGHWVHHHQEDICFDAIKDFVFGPGSHD